MIPTRSLSTMPALEQNEQDEAGLPSTLAKPSIDSKEGLLIRRIQGGEMDAFYELVRPCERAVFLVALTLLKNDADAEEVAQEAVLKAFQNIARFRQEAKFSTWLIQICINEAKMKLRKDRRHLYGSIEKGQQDDEGDYIPKDFADWREIPSEALEQKELREALTQALNSLPEKYRTVLILRDIQHLSINETVEVLDLSESNVKTRLLRARLQIRDAFAPGFDGAWSRGRAYEKLRPFWTSDSNAVCEWPAATALPFSALQPFPPRVRGDF